MFEELQIRNYRIFSDFKMGQLHRINLIAGSNNSGKTSLLEAIFLLTGGGNVQVLLNAPVVRVDPGVSVLGDTFFKPIFSELDTSQTIEISGQHVSLGQLTLTISWGQEQPSDGQLDYTAGTATTELPKEFSLIFRFHGPTGKETKSRIYAEGTEVKIEGSGSSVPFNATLLQSKSPNSREDALRLSRLRKEKRADLVMEALHVIEPRLLGIEENSSSGFPMIWGDIGLPELVPLSIMGEGMIHLARLVLAVSDASNGIVLLDEIENGFHHSVLPSVWRVIESAANQFNTQVFATTHSIECVRAAHSTLDPNSFRLHRLDVLEGQVSPVTYEPEIIDAAIRHNLEVR